MLVRINDSLLMGDHNQILQISKRRGERLETVGMHNFRFWINHHARIDVPLSDKSFT